MIKRMLFNSVAFLLCIFTFVLALDGCDRGSVFNGLQGHPDATMRLEAAGWDLRVYEFTPQTARDMTCVFVAGHRKAGLDCFPKERK